MQLIRCKASKSTKKYWIIRLKETSSWWRFLSSDSCSFSDGTTHRLVGADGVDLSPEHDRGEDQEEETLEAEKDEEDDRHRWREAAALCRESSCDQERWTSQIMGYK